MSVAFYGDYDTTETVVIPFNTFSSDDPSASVTITNLLAADVEIHKDGGTTQRASDNGVTVSIDFDSVTGNHIVSIDLSDNSDAGFYAAGSRYQVRIEGTTIDGATINAWVGSFSIGCTLRPTTSGRTIDVESGGCVGIDWGNVANQTTAVDLSGTDIQLCDTVTTLTGHTAQTGDSFARLGAPAGASVSADISTIDTNVDAILVDTNSLNDTKIPDTISLANINVQCDTALTDYDPPTKTEMDSAFTEIKGATWSNTTDTLEHIRNKQTDIETDTQDIQTGVDNIEAKLPTNYIMGSSSQTDKDDDIDAILVDTSSLNDTKIPDTISLANINDQVDTALSDIKLDHLVAVADADDPVNDSIISKLASATADWSTFSSASDSLEAIRDRGDSAWITGGGGSISDILNIQPLIPYSIDLADTSTYRLGIMLFNALDDLPSIAEITPGTVSIDRKAIGGTSWTSIVSDAACLEIAGLVYYDEVFDSGTGYAEGDSIRITFKNVKVTVAANDYEIIGATGRMFYTSIRDTMRGTDSAYTGTPPTAVAIRTEIDSNSTQLAAIVEDTGTTLPATLTSIDGKIDTIDTNVDAVLADTNELQTDMTNGGRIDLILDELTTQGDTNESKIDTVDTNVDSVVAKLPTNYIMGSSSQTDKDDEIDAIKAKTDNLPSGLAKNVALSNFMFVMVDSTDDISPKTGLTVTSTISKDGAGFSACTNSAVEVANGYYKIDLTQTEMNADIIALKFAATGANDTLVTIKTDS